MASTISKLQENWSPTILRTSSSHRGPATKFLLSGLKTTEPQVSNTILEEGLPKTTWECKCSFRFQLPRWCKHQLLTHGNHLPHKLTIGINLSLTIHGLRSKQHHRWINGLLSSHRTKWHKISHQTNGILFSQLKWITNLCKIKFKSHGGFKNHNSHNNPNSLLYLAKISGILSHKLLSLHHQLWQIRVSQDKFSNLTELVKHARNIRDHLPQQTILEYNQRCAPLIIVLVDKSSTQMELASTAQLDGLFLAVESTASTLKIKNKTWFLPWSQSLQCTIDPLMMPKASNAISSKRKSTSSRVPNMLVSDALSIQKVMVT